MTPNELMKKTIEGLGNFTYYLKCKFCGDTSNENELQVTKGHCPNCNNNGFDEVENERRKD